MVHKDKLKIGKQYGFRHYGQHILYLGHIRQINDDNTVILQLTYPKFMENENHRVSMDWLVTVKTAQSTIRGMAFSLYNGGLWNLIDETGRLLRHYTISPSNPPHPLHGLAIITMDESDDSTQPIEVTKRDDKWFIDDYNEIINANGYLPWLYQ